MGKILLPQTTSSLKNWQKYSLFFHKINFCGRLCNRITLMPNEAEAEDSTV